MEIIEYIFGGFFLSIMGFFCYMSAHIVEEQKRGKAIPLPWEKKR